MKKNKGSILKNALSVFLLLIGLFSIMLKSSTAYFTSGGNYQIQAIVDVSLIEFKVYQVNNLGAEREVKKDNDPNITSANYIEIESDANYVCIEPDTDYTLRLKFKNEDDGNTSLGAMFKIEFYACGINQSGASNDRLLNVNISGIDLASAPAIWSYYDLDAVLAIDSSDPDVEEPANFESTYSLYYLRSGSAGNYIYTQNISSTWDSNNDYYTIVTSPLTVEPGNWASTYNNYYIRANLSNSVVYAQNTSSDWLIDDYYSLNPVVVSDSNNRLESAPENFAANYANYYIRTGSAGNYIYTQNDSTDWSTTKDYVLLTASLIDNKPINWDKEVSNKSFTRSGAAGSYVYTQISTSGFVLKNGYYHYVNDSITQVDIQYIGDRATSGLFMMTGFRIPFSEFANLSGDSIRISINIQGFEAE